MVVGIKETRRRGGGRGGAHLGSELLSKRERERSLTRAGGTCQHQRAPRHLLRLDELHRDAERLARLLLTDQARRDLHRRAVLGEAEALDVAVRRDALPARGGLDLLDPHECLVGGREVGACRALPLVTPLLASSRLVGLTVGGLLPRFLETGGGLLLERGVWMGECASLPQRAGTSPTAAFFGARERRPSGRWRSVGIAF